MLPPPAITIEHVSHFFGSGELKKQILFDISATVSRGEIVIMTGPSGSGKTTLLTLVGGLRSVQQGSLKILGNEMKDATEGQLRKVRRSIGYIFQAHNLIPALTSSMNVQMALALNEKTTRAEAEVMAGDMLRAVGLGERIHYKPLQLSGGQRQRVAIARALVNRPQVLLADEPTAALDKQSGREVVDIMHDLAKRQGCTIFLVTHDNRILDIADRIIRLEDGYLTPTDAQKVISGE